MKILRYIFCAASALFFVAAFCACEKDGGVLGGESVDCGMRPRGINALRFLPKRPIISRNLKSCALKMSLCPVSKQRWNIARSR